jgi:predicted metal-dependent HD superfamily phosphohydrolase
MQKSEEQLIEEAMEHVQSMLKTVDHYPYHNSHHTLDVFRRVKYLCEQENIENDKKNDLLMAAIFHDTGFTQQYFKNEEIGVQIAHAYLAHIRWPKERIERVSRLIMATIPFSETTDILEEIIQDADLDNLGRRDYFVKSVLVRKELTTIGKLSISRDQWNENSQNLLKRFRFHTPSARAERNSYQHLNLERLEESYIPLYQS